VAITAAADRESRVWRVWRLGGVLEAVCGAHGSAVRDVEGVEGALQILVVVVIVRFLGIIYGQECLWQEEFLDLGPGSVRFVDAFELDAARRLDGGHGGDVIEPPNGFKGIGIEALTAILQAVELCKSCRWCQRARAWAFLEAHTV
jgi:hypothetical protein